MFKANKFLQHFAHTFLLSAENEYIPVTGDNYSVPSFYLLYREKRRREALSALKHFDGHIYAALILPRLCRQEQNQIQSNRMFGCCLRLLVRR